MADETDDRLARGMAIAIQGFAVANEVFDDLDAE